MRNLSTEQITQLNRYSVYVEKPDHFVFTLEDMMDAAKTADCLKTVEVISGSPNTVVAASFFMRRYGMFCAMQLTNLTMYDDMWQGTIDRLAFGAREEYGNRTVSTFTEEADWKPVDNRTEAIRSLLVQANSLISQIRKAVAVSPLTLWENIFGFLLWEYHVMLNHPATATEAREDLETLKDDHIWAGIAPYSRFAKYLNGSEPSALLNTTVRTTCCFSKDVPGLMQCGFCPLK
ncbi:hypothetical protein [Sporosarcina sp. Te-1]|uniref:hypothetical protein n=1 Tax=Sporosarcina sp. Te-1 TaxID=2818390 RepID=UPI001A9DF869|nr:hypothetical protein [Sporosarcina sp. Te-1]QTD40385.1 hypothetical protein J3U78_16625 [Sporosarcina sp. Te-1]